MVTVSDGYFTSNPQAITVTIPKKIKICHKGNNVISIGKMQALTISGGRLKAGTYMIRMQGDKIQTQKIVVQ